jgi:tetratricopeptide (TPR) repeat protein
MSAGRRCAARRPAVAVLVAVALASCSTKPAALQTLELTSASLSAPSATPSAAAPAGGIQAPAFARGREPPAEEAPAVPAQPVAATAPPAGAGTAIRTAEPAELAKGREEREAIESSIVFGSPSSLDRAAKLAAAPKSMRAEDAAALAAIAQAVSALAYPSPDRPPVPAVDPAALSGTAPALLAAIGEAAAGRVPAVPPEAAATSLGEIIPALALFGSVSSDAARRAVEALDRFSRLGVPSILPSMLRGADAERRGDWQGALGLYRSALAVAPDAWSASLGMGRALLSLKRSTDALSVLAPLADSKSGLLEFDRPYALALYANARYEEANPYVARVLISDPQDSRLVLVRAHLLIRSKAFQQAMPLLDAYGTVDPSNRLYLLLRCLESEGIRAREEALRWARKGLAAYPDDPELLVAASRILFAGPASGALEARTLAARAFDLTAPGAPVPGDPDGGESGPALAASRAAAGVEAARLLVADAASRYRWADASKYLARVGPGFEDKALAAKIMRKASDPRALDYASEWYKASPSSEAAAEAYIRGLAAAGPGSERQAQELIARVLPGTITPQFRSTLYYVQSRLQKSDEAALTLLRSALVENADNAEALAAVYDIQMRRKDYAKARFYLKQAIAISPDDPELDERMRALDAAAPQ